MTKWFRSTRGRLHHMGSAIKCWVHAWLDPPYRTVDVDARLPSKLKKRTVYIVAEDGFEEQAAMLCPCGCTYVLHMNLLPDDRPLWRVSRHADGTASLRPSVWRKKDCRSHFCFRKGRVIWVGDRRR
jgi:hypothetical protein